MHLLGVMMAEAGAESGFGGFGRSMAEAGAGIWGVLEGPWQRLEEGQGLGSLEGPWHRLEQGQGLGGFYPICPLIASDSLSVP